MTCFLTSSPTVYRSWTLDSSNGFAAALKAAVPAGCRGLFICSSPDDPETNDFYAEQMRGSLERAGLVFSGFDILDRRSAARAGELTAGAGLIILAGGHVPTQNRFFAEIGLREKLWGYGGVILGISAGSMNSADIVYAHPEEKGEATDPAYQRFLPGLGLTGTMILPHFQHIRDLTLDGLRVIEEIALPDSMGREFLALPDGSYLYITGGREELRGEAWLIKDGSIAQISREGETLLFKE